MASKGVNMVILLGNLGSDPETRFFPDGGAITNASLATSVTWKDRQTGEQREKTEWHRLSFKDRGNYRLGQIAGEYLKKGSKIWIRGSLETRKWQDQSGADRYTTQIVVDELQMLSHPDNGQQNQHQGGGHQGQHQQQGHQQQGQQHQGQNYGHGQAPQQGQQQPPHGSQPPPSHGGFDDFDDDIPFAPAGDGMLT